MDEHGVHKHESITNALKKLNTDVKFIPSGMTSFLQPLDVAINSVFKAQLRQERENGFVKVKRCSPRKDIESDLRGSQSWTL